MAHTHEMSKSLRNTMVSLFAFAILAGCTTPTEEDPNALAILPEETVCRILPADRIAEFLPPANYIYDPDTSQRDASYILHMEDTNSADGTCVLQIMGTTDTNLLVISHSGVKAAEWLTRDCNGPRLDLKPPAIGTIEMGASCLQGDSELSSAEAWIVSCMR